jgi:tRNA(Arg) A34 adenosine deaminase TadA
MTYDPLIVDTPAWVADAFAEGGRYTSDEDRMRVAVEAARRNVELGTGGPFGAAIFEARSGRLVAVGVNRVMPLNNSVLHGETMAIMLAQRRVGSCTLAGELEHELFTSCEPCAMCLGAAQWSGVTRLVWAATRRDARRVGFDEGPVFAKSYAYLRDRGMRFDGGVLREAGRAALQLYAATGGTIYGS